MAYHVHRIRLRSNIYLKLLGILTIALLLYLFREYNNLNFDKTENLGPRLQVHSKPHVSKLVTVVFRQFQEFENDVADSVQSFVTAYPNLPIVVLCQSQPYPPFPFSYANDTLKNLQIVSLGLKLGTPPQFLNPLTYIKTEYILFVPDSTRVLRRTLQQAIAAVTLNPRQPLAIAIGNSPLICQRLYWEYANWTLMFRKDVFGNSCDGIHGNHALLIKTSLLHHLPQPFMLPFPEALYLQTTVKQIKIKIIEGKLGAGRTVLKSPTAKQRALKQAREYRIALYKNLGVKLVVREDNKVQWFGCKRDTPRCFPSVVGVPSYVYERRNTPPCCRRNMRRTAAHVLRYLAGVGARCWLETTSLLGAVLHNDLLPWAEYVEIGIHADDLSRVPFLKRGGIDSDGFVWERATKGHYYSVAYSQTNRAYVLVLPFAAKNGTMKPADWVLAHQRDFPERHMHPLAQPKDIHCWAKASPKDLHNDRSYASRIQAPPTILTRSSIHRIQFAGQVAPAPNDARSFLDWKLGANSIERCHKLGPRLLYHYM